MTMYALLKIYNKRFTNVSTTHLHTSGEGDIYIYFIYTNDKLNKLNKSNKRNK